MWGDGGFQSLQSWFWVAGVEFKWICIREASKQETQSSGLPGLYFYVLWKEEGRCKDGYH
jgi:hypothetical protein